MITLSFCSALTHSLLNAGKRVVAIAMAIVWFREGFTKQIAVGLFFVMVGGCWYTVETKQRPKSSGYAKPLACLILLHALYNLDSYL